MSRNLLLSKIQSNSTLIASKLVSVQSLLEARKAKVSAEIEAEKISLVKENEEIRKEIQELVNKLNQLEPASNVPPGAVFADKVTSQPKPSSVSAASVPQASAKSATSQPPSKQSPAEKKQTKPDANQKPEKVPKEKVSTQQVSKEKVPKQQVPKEKVPSEPEKPVDVSRLDLRVGKIVSVEKHPDADSLYVEQVDLGEAKARTVVSGLVKFVPLDQMADRLVLLLCNLKPAKMRGVTSEAMVMCASSPDKVEILIPPPGAVIGDRACVEGFPGEPDAQLNPKKKVWEEVAPDLKTDGAGVACYKGAAIVIPGKGPFKSESLKNVQVK